MRRYLSILVVSSSLWLLASCQERMVCPAYQSMYIFDDSVRTHFFSRFGADSLPKHYGRVIVTDNGIVEMKKRSAKLREMRTVAMEDVLVPKSDADSALVRERSLDELNRLKDEVEQPASAN